MIEIYLTLSKVFYYNIRKVNSLISMHQSVEAPSSLAIEQYRFQKSDLAGHLLSVIADLDLKEEIKIFATT